MFATKKVLHTNVAKCWDALRPNSSQAHDSWSELRTSEETYIDVRLESDTPKRYPKADLRKYLFNRLKRKLIWPGCVNVDGSSVYTTVGCTVGSLLSSVVLSFAKLSPQENLSLLYSIFHRALYSILLYMHYSIERCTVAVVYLYCTKYSSLSVTKYQCCHLHKSCRLSSSFLYGEQYRLSDYARAKQELNTS